MLAVSPHSLAGPDGSPRLVELPRPEPAAGEVLLQVSAAGINHADLLQLRGAYPAPEGESEVPGLEAAGVVAGWGSGVSGWRMGERAMALLAGGGQAEWAVAPAGQLMRVPDDWPLEVAASFPEAAITAWTNLVAEGGLRSGETVLVTGAGGSMGSFAVSLAAALGARVVASVRDAEAPGVAASARERGAAAVISAGPGQADRVRAATDGAGVDLALDFVGGEGVAECLAALRPRGRVVLLGLLAGARTTIDLRSLLSRRLILLGSTLRPRSRDEKAGLVTAFWRFAEPRLAEGRLAPAVDRVFDAERVASAYAALARGGTRGKLVLRFG